MNTIYIKEEKSIDSIKTYLTIYKDKIIVSENPKHEQGYEIKYKSRRIKDEFIEKLGKENIITLEDRYIKCKGFDHRYRNPVFEVLNDYNKEVIDESCIGEIYECFWK